MEILINSSVRVYDAVAAGRMLEALSYPYPSEWSRVNSFMNPLGPSPARGLFLLLRKDLDSLDLNSGSFTIKFKDDTGAEVTANNLLISKEPQCLSPGKDADENSLYLVEFSDARHTLQPGFFAFPINEQYNVRAAGYGTDRYDETENAGSAWTWSTMTEDVWNKMTAILGAFTSLPVTPDGSPEDWKFPGVSAWTALNQILHRIGCAVKWDHTLTSAQYSIVQLGATDSGATTAQSSAAAKLIYDRMYMPVNRGKLPGKLVVYFGRRQEDYGTEQTTPKDNTQFTTSAVVSKEITLTTTGTDANTKHHVWDDLPAEFDVSDGFTPSSTAGNDAALQTRAQERADDFERMVITGGGRLHKVYTGIISGLATGSTIKGVAYRQDLVGYGTGRVGGLVTEIINHPYWGLRVEEHPASPLECWGACQSIGTQAPAFGPTFPLYPHILQIVELTTGTADGSARFTAKVELYDPDARTWTDKEDCYAIDINGITTLTSGNRFLGRLSGMDTDKPVYQIDGGSDPVRYRLTVREVDTSPSVSNVTIIEFDQSDGFVVTEAAAGRARVDLPKNVDRGAKAYNDATQVITLGTEEDLNANQENYDTNTYHDNATNNQNIVFTGGIGRYVVCWALQADVTFAGADVVPEWFEVYAKYNGSEVTHSRHCCDFWRISYIPNSTATAATAVEKDHNCLQGAFMVDVTDVTHVLKMVGDAQGNTLDVTVDDFVFSVHKLNRGGSPDTTA